VRDLRSKLREKGIDFNRDCFIYEVCNPQRAKKVLEVNAEISTALPCRISIYPEGSRRNADHDPRHRHTGDVSHTGTEDRG
jgi:uncharacterized protein (DUF302 family)